MPNLGSPVTNLINFLILNMAVGNKRDLEVHFQKDCGDDQNCNYSNMLLSASFLLSEANRKYFEVFTIGNMVVHEMYRTCDPQQEFLALNLRSILHSLGMIGFARILLLGFVMDESADSQLAGIFRRPDGPCLDDHNLVWSSMVSSEEYFYEWFFLRVEDVDQAKPAIYRYDEPVYQKFQPMAVHGAPWYYLETDEFGMPGPFWLVKVLVLPGPVKHVKWMPGGFSWPGISAAEHSH